MQNIFFSHGSSAARGVCIILPNNTDFKLVQEVTDSEGRFILLHLILNDLELVLANVYAPTKDKKQEQLDFVNYVFNVLKDFTGKTIIVGGDFNTCLNPSLDKLGGSLENQSETSKQLINFCDLYNLFDVSDFIIQKVKLSHGEIKVGQY